MRRRIEQILIASIFLVITVPTHAAPLVYRDVIDDGAAEILRACVESLETKFQGQLKWQPIINKDSHELLQEYQAEPRKMHYRLGQRILLVTGLVDALKVVREERGETRKEFEQRISELLNALDPILVEDLKLIKFPLPSSSTWPTQDIWHSSGYQVGYCHAELLKYLTCKIERGCRENWCINCRDNLSAFITKQIQMSNNHLFLNNASVLSAGIAAVQRSNADRMYPPPTRHPSFTVRTDANGRSLIGAYGPFGSNGAVVYRKVADEVPVVQLSILSALIDSPTELEAAATRAISDENRTLIDRHGHGAYFHSYSFAKAASALPYLPIELRQKLASFLVARACPSALLKEVVTGTNNFKTFRLSNIGSLLSMTASVLRRNQLVAAATYDSIGKRLLITHNLDSTMLTARIWPATKQLPSIANTNQAFHPDLTLSSSTTTVDLKSESLPKAIESGQRFVLLLFANQAGGSGGKPIVLNIEANQTKGQGNELR